MAQSNHIYVIVVSCIINIQCVAATQVQSYACDGNHNYALLLQKSFWSFMKPCMDIYEAVYATLARLGGSFPPVHDPI
jgi:hypothetical protein